MLAVQPAKAPLPEPELSLYTQGGDRRGFDLCYTNVILPTAKEYDFYPLYLRAFRLLPHSYMYINEKGWALVLQGVDPDKGSYVDIKYILVYPQYRRQGFFRAVHNECARTGKRVVATTEKSCMVRALHALGYECTHWATSATEKHRIKESCNSDTLIT